MTSAPALVRADTVTEPGQVTSGASATTTVGGGAGVGALGVAVHPAPPTSTSRTNTQTERTAVIKTPWEADKLRPHVDKELYPSELP